MMIDSMVMDAKHEFYNKMQKALKYRDVPELGQTLYNMSKRGLILRFKESEDVIYYFLAPWVIGIWEFQLNRLNKENIPLYEKFHQEGIVASAKGKSN